jgi:hypothetical protein
MLWGRPPARKIEPEASPSAVKEETSAPVESSPEVALADLERDTHPAEQEQAVETGPEAAAASELQTAPDSAERRLEVDLPKAEVPVEQVDEQATLVQVAMDLNGLEAIAPSPPEPEPEFEAFEEEVNLLEAMMVASLGQRLEAETPETTGTATEEPAREPERSGGEPKPSAREPGQVEPVAASVAEDKKAAAPVPETAQPDAAAAPVEPAAMDEPAHLSPAAAEITEPEEEATDPNADRPKPDLVAEEERPEEALFEEKLAAPVHAAEEVEPEEELEVYAPPPTSAGRAVPSRKAEVEELEQDDPDPEPAVEDLWLWVDPRYEGGYSPATFDLSTFLQRAISLFQSKPWSGGQRPGRIAVHAKEATDDFESVAQHLELAVIEDPRVSSGTYWLGLGSDGQSEN